VDGFMVGHALIQVKILAGRPRNSYAGQIKSDARVIIFKELKEKTSNPSEWRILQFSIIM